jgi:hypothetical protein
MNSNASMRSRGVALSHSCRSYSSASAIVPDQNVHPFDPRCCS